jgi:exopolysaccharide biosynthesis polyprenyl glycosylphosphotransferase
MTKIKTAVIFLGDIVILYGALILTLFSRYGLDFKEHLNAHLKPFSLIFLVWLLVFYLADLYKIKFLRINLKTVQNFVLAIIISVVASIIFFYLFPSIFRLTPKTNLVLFALIFGVSGFLWRFILSKIFISGGLKEKLLVIGDSPIIDEIADCLKNNPQIGYEIAGIEKNISDIEKFIAERGINAVVIQTQLKKEPEFSRIIYRLLPLKISLIDLITFYETIFQKLPLEELDENWFIEKIAGRRRLYDIAKRMIEFSLSLILAVALLPLMILNAGLIKLTSKGAVIYKQERTGENGKPFILFKFRTMKSNVAGPLATEKNDRRITAVGKILRFTHLDELPQLWNILKGDISFIGPRPESSELVEIYKKLPYYEIRHIIKPGLTGWAQVNYKPSASLEEAREKLKYDIYYIKNRSFILDLLIFIKTIRYLFTPHQ